MFHKCSTYIEIKKMYHQLAQKLHPDKGGSHSLMATLIESYNEALKKITKPKFQNVEHEVFEGDKRLDIISSLFDGILSGQCYDWQIVTTIAASLEKQGYLTANQYNALVKIYYAFEMDTATVG